jgi:hypothetical protein
MREITVETLPETARSLSKILGDELLGQMVGGYDSADARGMSDHVRRRGRAHPFAVAWDDLIKGAERSRSEGRFLLSEDAYFLLEMLEDLSSAERDPEFVSLLKRLTGRDQFFSTAFEAFIFSAYKGLAVPIALVPEAGTRRERRPDLVARAGGFWPIYLECKSLQDDVRREEQAWSEIESRSAKYLEASPRNLKLRLEAGRRITNNDVTTVVSAVSGLVDNFPLAKGAEAGGVRIQLSEIMPIGSRLHMPLETLRRDGERGWLEASIDPKTNMADRVWIVESQQFPDVEQTDRLIRLFRDAANQLPKDCPGVVHLQVPYRASAHFMKVVDRARPGLERELSRRKHVCAIVITGRFLNQRMVSEGHPIDATHVVIPNFEASKEIPPGFRLLGSTLISEIFANVGHADLSQMPNGEFEMTAEGAILFEFTINEPLTEQLGRYTYRYCSSDGRRQASAWQTYANAFRIEVVHETFGRRELNFDLNHLTVGTLHKMAFTWSADDLACALDGGAVMR